jgi:hypothetical protein
MFNSQNGLENSRIQFGMFTTINDSKDATDVFKSLKGDPQRIYG